MTTPAPRTAFDLATLIAPLRRAEFFNAYWEREPLHVSRNDAHHYEHVLTNESLERIISSSDLRYPAIQLAKNGSYLNPEVYTTNIKHGSEFFNGVPNVEQIQAEYRAGATIVLSALQRTRGPLHDLCVTLEDEFSHHVHANAYLTPARTPGFTPHYDTHEVFVLQIAGSKVWRVFEPPLALPHRTQPFVPGRYSSPAKPMLELELKQGDLLYLPRGYVHAAHASDTYSAHVTVGITVYTWVDLLAELGAVAKESVDLRRALPPGFANRDELKVKLSEGLDRCLDELQRKVDSNDLVDVFLRKVSSSRIRSDATFHSDVKSIGLDTHFRAPETGSYRISVEQRGTVLEFGGKKFVLPDNIKATIDEMCRRRSFRLLDLAGPLSNDGKLTLARFLHGERFLTLID